MPSNDGGLGTHLVGDKIVMGNLNLHVTKLLGEGGFSYVYLVKDLSDSSGLSGSLHLNKSKESNANAEDNNKNTASNTPSHNKKEPLVLKVTSIHSRAQRDIAEKEAKLLSRLSHPSIVKMYDTCYRTVAHSKKSNQQQKERPQHLILMEFCEGGHALDVCSQLAAKGQRFDLSTLIIAFGQICNAVSYLHAQRPPIVHRDLKPVNFLVKNGAYKLCDFGSAVFGHVDLRTSKARAEAEEVIQKTTTQMFRAPEMIDLFMAKKLTQATDVWALGCCLYSLAFLQNCFEEGSNLAILSLKYTIPDDNPYGEGLVELLDRMLTVDSKARADMTEVILCLSAVYSGRPLPPRKKSKSSSTSSKPDEVAGSGSMESQEGEEEAVPPSGAVGSYRTDGQGIQEPVYDPTKATEGKKLASNSVAARRKRAAAAAVPTTPAGAAAPTTAAPIPAAPSANPNAATTLSLSAADPLAFSNFQDKAGDVAFGTDAGFGEMKGFETKEGETSANEFFGSFGKSESMGGSEEGAGNDGFDIAFDPNAWGEAPSSGGGDAERALSGSMNTEEEGEPTDQPIDLGSSPVDDSEIVPADGDDKPGGSNQAESQSQRKERSSRRRRPGGSSRSSRPTTGTTSGGHVNGANLESGIEKMSILESGSEEKKERRPRGNREDGDDRAKRSGSRSRRKGRPASSRNPPVQQAAPLPAAAPAEAKADSEKQRAAPKKGGSFLQRAFTRNKNPPPEDS